MRMISTCGNGSEPTDDFFQPFVGENQRVAAGKKHIAHFRVALDVVESMFQLFLPEGKILAADHSAAGAVAAVHGAFMRQKKKYPVRISVHQPGRGGILVFAQRVGHVAGLHVKFPDGWNRLLFNGAVRLRPGGSEKHSKG